MPITLSAKQQERVEQLEQLTADTLEKLADDLAKGHTQSFIEFLSFWSRLPRYSYRNLLLIQAQKPDATRVASYGGWKKVGGQVASGQQAIWIWAPMLVKERDEQTGEQVEKIAGYKAVPVFDLSQLTDESREKLPQPFPKLADDAEAEALWESIKDRCKERGIRIFEMRLRMGIQGSCEASGLIRIEERLDTQTKILVGAHELGHFCGHFGEQAKDLTNADCEIEAEACSVVIGAMLGIEHSSARDYLLNWNGNADTLRGHFQAIQKLVRQVVDILGLGEQKSQAEAA